MSRSLCLLLPCLVLFALPARAQAPDIATAEQVAIAFYKMAGLQPSFSAWAQDSALYHETPKARRPRVAAREAARLQAAYQAFSPGTQLLNVATTAQVQLREEQDPDLSTRRLYSLEWTFETENHDFFPYEFRDMVFALAPQGMKEFQSAALTSAQHAYIKERLGNKRTARLVLHMRSHYADGKAPLKIHGEDVWVLVTQMAGASLWDESGGLIWEKSAGWYVSPQTRALNALKADREK